MTDTDIQTDNRILGLRLHSKQFTDDDDDDDDDDNLSIYQRTLVNTCVLAPITYFNMSNVKQYGKHPHNHDHHRHRWIVTDDSSGNENFGLVSS